MCTSHTDVRPNELTIGDPNKDVVMTIAQISDCHLHSTENAEINQWYAERNMQDTVSSAQKVWNSIKYYDKPS